MNSKNFMILTMLTMLSTIALTMGLFVYVAQHDLAWLPIYEIGESFVSNNFMASEFLTAMSDVFVIGSEIPKVLDYIWLLSMITLFTQMCYSAYNSKREGFFQIFSFLNYGVLILLFVANYYYKISEWFYDIIINKLLMGIQFNVPFYTFYMDNFGVITLVMIGILMLLNFVDFDLNKFNIRKERNNPQEVINDEV